ncbi:MAG: tetratricopeptide repeat protein [Bryobacteraceae bacterium]
MTRTLFFACLLALILTLGSKAQSGNNPPQQNQEKAKQQPSTNTPAVQQPPEEDNPPEEDASVAPKVYPLNPLESERNIKVGNFYMRQRTLRGYRAAIGRFEDATRYNPSSAEAFFRLGEAQEKLKNKDAAKTAFEKVLRLAPDSKLAHEAKKRLDSKS